MLLDIMIIIINNRKNKDKKNLSRQYFLKEIITVTVLSILQVTILAVRVFRET